jgi:hypothetical protein
LHVILLHSKMLPHLVQDVFSSPNSRFETIDLTDRVINDNEEADDLCGLLLISLSIPGMCVIMKTLIISHLG